ncbi:integrase [Kaistia sp. 32K]|uniref:tyrosine-type recombinase/integrase n=1 Tax=Kaistia sp. 32K TaxID=2795690 RepID=UPI0019165F3E|nr:site-specific integrase [Kaistia sp. 32K]BCP56337.1 integrase [Kaistia sp. 32K]
MAKLTKTFVDGLKAPEAGDAWHWDSEVEGFGVRVQASGRKSYVVRYRVKSATKTQRKMTLARCSDMPPDKARELARKVFAQVAEGLDPAAELKPTKAEVNQATVERMFQGYVNQLKAAGQASAVEVERMLLKSKRVPSAADAIGRNIPACEVMPIDVVNYVAAFYQRGKRGAADKARSYIASAYAWAITSANDYTVPVDQRIDWGITRNPAADVAKDQGAIQTRDRNLTASEIRALWKATLDDDGGFSLEVGACVRMLLGCGQRVQETLRIEGAEIDLAAQVWKMPKEKTKGKKHPHTIPLPAVVIPTLRMLIEKHGAGPLFPGRTGSGDELICHRSINQAIGRWLDRLDVNLTHFQTRDIRRTWKSRSHDAGVDRFTRDLIQQHAKNDTGSKNYDRADYLPQMREAMTKWSAWMGIVLSGGQPPAHGEPLIKVA